MKITSVEAMVLKAPVEGISGWRAASWAMPFSFAETTLVKIATDEGLVGWGEVHAPVAPEVTKTLIDRLLAPAVIGEDPRQTGFLWDKMYDRMRPRGHSNGFMLEAMSGIDIALWDITGKATGLPVYMLMGGAYRQKIRTYASILQWMEPRDLAATAADLVKRGFTAMKIKIGQDPYIDAAKIKAVREAVGPQIDLMADANCRYTVTDAQRICRILEQYDYKWIEEPVPPEDISGYIALRKSVGIAVAGGECECTHYRFAYLINSGVYDIIQPDICRAGGLTACHRIGLIADAQNLQFAPHVSINSVIHIAASLHWAAAGKNLRIHEYPVFPNPLVDELLETPLQWEDGCLVLPEQPGLGIKVREDVVEKYRTA
jgi:D-galactarolactone cycloisomerase